MIRIEIEANSVPDLYHKISGLLEAYRPIDNTGDYLEPAGGKIIEGLQDAVAHAHGEPTLVETVRMAAVAEAAFPPKPRGRPRKQQNAQPAVAENTGSTAPVSSPPTGEQASTSAAGIESPKVGEGQAPVDRQDPEPQPSITYTAEQVRAKLQEFLVTPGGDRGLQLAGDVLAQFGLAKVKQVNDNPQHFAGIVAAVDTELVKLAVAK